MDPNKLLKLVLMTEGKDRLSLTKGSFNRACRDLPLVDLDHANEGLFAIELIKLLVRADKRTTYEEYTLLKSIMPLELSFEAFKRKMGRPQGEYFPNLADEMIDHFSPSGKRAACTFALCLFEADDVLTPDEYALFYKLLE